MKKLYTAMLLALATASAMAQTPIWTDDFSVASHWMMGHLGNTTGDWTIGTTPPGGPPYNIDPIASTTAANGFALYDSNVLCAADSGYIQNVTPIDLSAYPGVVLRFEEFYRNYSGHTYVQVSNDNVNWTTIQVNADLPSNAETANPATLTVPITATAGGHSQVWIRFLYGGDCDFAWMVDDVAILPQPENDLKLFSAATTAWADFNTTTYDSLGYTVYPITELRPLQPNVKIVNNGSQPATNVTAHITTSDGFDQSMNFGTLASGDTVPFYPATNWTPTATIGDHMVYYSVSADATDANPGDNADTLKVGVSDYIYALDKGALDGEYSDDAAGDAFSLGNVYYANVDETLYGIDVAFSPNSAVGVELKAQLLDPNTTNFDPIAETGFHTLATSELATNGGNQVVTFVFDTPVQLTAGTDYLATVQHFGGADVLIGTSGYSPASVSFIYSSSQADWFYVTSTPMVRMNFNASAGIAKNDFQNGIGLGQNYPNPANTGSTRIDFSLDQSASVHMELRDISGKLVRTLVDGTMSPGVHHVDVNTADLGSGVYFYTLTTDKAVSTKRMTVVR